MPARQAASCICWQPNRLQGKRIGNVIGAPAAGRFDGVNKGVEPGGGRQPGWQCEGQLRVKNGDIRAEFIIPCPRFVTVAISQYAGAGDFSAGAAGGRYHYAGQVTGKRVGAQHVVVHGTSANCGAGGQLGNVKRCTTPNSDDGRVAQPEGGGDGRIDRRDVWFAGRGHEAFGDMAGQQFLYPSDDPGGGYAFIRNQQNIVHGPGCQLPG
jgi:hypothetical protein